jgi:hypothetical protein
VVLQLVFVDSSVLHNEADVCRVHQQANILGRITVDEEDICIGPSLITPSGLWGASAGCDQGLVDAGQQRDPERLARPENRR